MPCMEIARYAPRARHGGYERHGVVEIDLDTGAISEYFGRYFECPCGEGMNDGDPALYDAAGRFVAHANCEALVRVAVGVMP